MTAAAARRTATQSAPSVRLAPAPRVAPALIGRTPSEARALLGTVFTLCKHAHVDAADRAFAGARGETMPPQAQSARTRATRIEAIREQGLRILLDWPLLLGEPADLDAGARWMRLSAELALCDARADAIARAASFLERAVYGMPPAAWLEVTGAADWAAAGATGAARVVGRMDALARAVRLAIDGRDVSVMARRAGHPRLDGAAPLAARYLARLLDLAATLAGLDEPADERVWTARGQLDHRCRLRGDRIADYAIVSPTEVHFGIDGAATRALDAARCAPPSLRRPLTEAVVRAFDPCVAFTIEAG